MNVTIPITRMPGSGADVPLPAYETPGSSGMDLRAAVGSPLTLAPGETVLVPCGIMMAIPEGYEGQVRPRSGLAAKHGIGVLNAPGTIDSDYRGEVKVILANFGKIPFVVNRGERIAQLVIAPVARAAWEERSDIGGTGRGSGGFGHTGK
ncbi:MAG TPA: dUTP diphosphatase [Bacteroidota bacterium]|nr:dUTP diphosphatase [Bacteroidota bacterium]